MFGLPIAFATPWILTALVALPVIWWLLRLTPPRPQQEVFPPTRILARLQEKEETPAQSPWWLTLLRLGMAALAILAMAGPILNPQQSALEGDGPVLLVVDNGWAAAADWEDRRNTALSVISEARDANRSVILQSTAAHEEWTTEPISPDEAANLLLATEPEPLEPSHAKTAARLETLSQTVTVGDIVLLSDGLTHEGTQALSDRFEALGSPLSVFEKSGSDAIAIETIDNNPKELVGTIIRADSSETITRTVLAKDEKGLTVARATAEFNQGDKRASFSLTEPVELRNQITRLEIETNRNAAAVQLLDESNRRRLVGLISGETFDQSQPLLSPLYYISRALEPFSDLRRSTDANVAAAVPDLINQGVSAIVLADVGTLPEEATERLEQWIENGGMLIRFSGPRLGTAAETETLLPVDIRPGDRSLGGALSWETPKPLAPFEPESPFFGLEAPRDVVINKQLLALQETNLEEKTWAVLEDGTPLVTADQKGAGWIVLYHVGSNNDWSNLPLSGTFVEMLRRTVNLARSGGVRTQGSEEIVLPPLRLLDGEGGFVDPAPTAKPLVIKADTPITVTAENPPGLYGTEDGFTALNLIEEETELTRLDASTFFAGANRQSYITGQKQDLKNWLLLIAAILLVIDCLAVLWMAGVLKPRRSSFGGSATASAVALVLTGALIASLVTSSPAYAQSQEDDVDFTSALKTRLAYVVTGVPEVDEITEAGMRGLTQFIFSRTALEPGDPIGLDMATDELSFYSLIYWPVDPRAEMPDAETMARVDAFMKEGGSILFDTRDQISGIFGGTANSPAARTLQQMLANLDIPGLEPVPEDHVLTKAFYLLDTFPGRYSGGDLWVQVSQNSEENEGRPARVGDGVSPIMITSNDFVGAWAVDNELRPLLPTIPPDPAQRNYAFRSGVNLMMYALTGNYKSDQVHLPALLERLGQ